MLKSKRSVDLEKYKAIIPPYLRNSGRSIMVRLYVSITRQERMIRLLRTCGVRIDLRMFRERNGPRPVRQRSVREKRSKSAIAFVLFHKFADGASTCRSIFVDVGSDACTGEWIEGSVIAEEVIVVRDFC